MSRYSLKPLPQRADLFEVAVGWDAGLGTFFVCVFGTLDANAEPAVCHWQGATPGEIVRAHKVVALAACFAEVPEHLVSQLELDRLQTKPDQRRANPR
jgi:hypothetical protein